MNNLTNQEIIPHKIMWANQEEIIWNLIDNEPFPVENKIYTLLSKFIDYKKWVVDFKKLYIEWLYEDNMEIYKINSEINERVIKILPDLNNSLKKDKIIVYYWFDVDRDKKMKFKWKNCPYSNEKLIKLNKDDNFLISKNNFIVLPI